MKFGSMNKFLYLIIFLLLIGFKFFLIFVMREFFKWIFVFFKILLL